MDKCILVQHLNSINSVINETFRTSQRIKLICFDVSVEHIVFGASSGGIYIFKREPCEFLKLIPSKEGSAIKIVIDPKGKSMAIASSKGLIIVLENFLDVNVRPVIYSEHEGGAVTAIKWHGNSVYSGDDTGRIAVFSLSNLLTIFQTPSATLMHLGSNIVQIDAYLNYLLVSTKTRIYLCDTEKECYKQIGKKLKDGQFGACFFSEVNGDSPDTCQNFKGIFKTIKEDESFMTSLNNSDVKIYCARPGARLWEASFDAKVLVTHQFRNSLNQNPSDLLCLKDDVNARVNVSSFHDVFGVPKNFNFGKIYPALCRFIFTYDNDGVYFFDPTISKLVFWSNSFKNIKQISILGSAMYVWQDKLQINVVSLELLEDLIIKTLLGKQYYFCAELCTIYYDDVLNLIEHSKRIHLIAILKAKLLELGAADLLENVSPILQALDRFNKKQTAGKKLSNGIVRVENSHVESANYEKRLPDIPAENDISRQNTHVEENVDVLALYKQFQLNKTHKTAELTESTLLMSGLSLDELLRLFQKFIKHVQNVENADATLWCKEQFLKRASKSDLDLETLGANTFSFLSDSLVESCNSKHFGCKCGFPLPNAHQKRPEYYNLACKLLSRCEKVDSYLLIIPYMYKYVLSSTKDLNLPLIVQFNDSEVFEQLVTSFTYDTWDEVLKLHLKLRKGKCLNCEQNVVVDDVIPWSKLGALMIKSIGPQNTTRLLKRYSQHIPSGSLDTRFYQYCILASTFDEPSLAVNFMDKVLAEDTQPKFEEQMEKFLQKKYLGHQNQPVQCSPARDTLKCAYCNIPLGESIFSDSKKYDCGHNFHVLCSARNDGICNVCAKS